MTTTDPGPLYSVVIPVYESASSLLESASRLIAVFDQHVKGTCEIIFVDDGSKSTATRAALEEAWKTYGEVRVVRLMRNYGKAGAVLCGLHHARGQWIITLDDDLQQRPEDIPALIEHQHHDVVVAGFVERKDSLSNRFSSWLKGHFDRMILGVPCRMTPLKLIKRPVVDAMLSVKTSRPFIPALLAYATNDFVSVPVSHAPSQLSRSRFGLLKRIRQFSNLVIGNSTILLRAVAVFGATVAVAGFCFALLVLVRKLLGSSIAPGWASLIVINLTFGGLVLVTLGMIGEYLLRILEGTASRPAFIVRESLESCEDETGE